MPERQWAILLLPEREFVVIKNQGVLTCTDYLGLVDHGRWLFGTTRKWTVCEYSEYSRVNCCGEIQ